MNFMDRVDLFNRVVKHHKVRRAVMNHAGRMTESAKVLVDVRAAIVEVFSEMGKAELGADIATSAIIARHRERTEKFALAMREQFTEQGDTEDGEWEIVPEAAASS